MVFQKIVSLQLKGPPQFEDLLSLNFGTTAAWNSATRCFVKFCFKIGKFSGPKSILDLSAK